MGRLPNQKGAHLYSLRVRGGSMLIAGELGVVMLSRDGGQRFQALSPPYQGSFFTGELTGSGELIVAGLRGNVWKSRDSGETWTRIATPVPVSVTTSTTASDGGVLFANQAGDVFRLSGEELKSLGLPPLPPVNSLRALSPETLMAFGVQGPIVLPSNPSPRQ